MTFSPQFARVRSTLSINRILSSYLTFASIERQGRKILGGLSTTWLLGHGKVEGVGRGMCSLPHRAQRKFCLYNIIYMETILYKKLTIIFMEIHQNSSYVQY